MITITINTDSAAFDDDISAEVQRILHELANSNPMDRAYNASNIKDINGNTVGKIEVIG